MQELIENYQQQFAELNPSQDGLMLLRQQGLAKLGEIGFPTTRDENWRYTNIKPLLKQAFNIVTQTQTEVTPEQASAFDIEGFERIRMY